ncbi:unnamed protein product [Caenorhabditis auriculariae]|uniref:Uncharacterized protein n=1 Tax=Caenorhabditis auriculariae TaxID=2777116 RepID=A0A8S1H4F7_9PELO|nr:unnamed protein product [Caenorhabditis auriculariae]
MRVTCLMLDVKSRKRKKERKTQDTRFLCTRLCNAKHLTGAGLAPRVEMLVLLPIAVTLVSFTTCLPESHFFSLANFIGSEDETPRSRTSAIVEQRTELGRMVLLLCTKTCAKHRSEVPVWVKEFNHARKYEGIEAITYYYHTFRQPLPFFNETILTHMPNLIYFIAQKSFPYNGDPSNKASVMSWLDEIDQMRRIEPTNHLELDAIMSGTTNCSNKYLIIASSEQCPMDYWSNIARVATEYGIFPVHLVLPLPPLMNIILFKRLAYLDPSGCQVLVLLYEDNYSELSGDVNPGAVREWIQVLFPEEEGDCPALQDIFWQPIKDSLTELQLLYFTGEQEIQIFNHRKSYVLVGLTGGVAVIALAMSIFWGLNGSAFAG